MILSPHTGAGKHQDLEPLQSMANLVMLRGAQNTTTGKVAQTPDAPGLPIPSKPLPKPSLNLAD